LGHTAGVEEKALPFFRQNNEAFAAFRLLREGLSGDETLPLEIPKVTGHPFGISAVGELGEVRRINDTKLADFDERSELGLAEEVGAVFQIVGADGVVYFWSLAVVS
jgi:hypothetical protein